MRLAEPDRPPGQQISTNGQRTSRAGGVSSFAAAAGKMIAGLLAVRSLRATPETTPDRVRGRSE